MIAHLHEREKALGRFGLTGREAEWVALVCLHSGAFTRPQFCHYFGDARRNRAMRFVRDLVERGFAVEFDLPYRHGVARACRISHKPIYRELGIENVRHRREADESLLIRRLLSLDFILEHPELPWLPTEQEKVDFFELLGIDRNRIPHRIYHGAVGKQTRHFALKLPIACDAKSATFGYIDPGNTTDTELRSWGAAHEWLWRALRGKGIKVQVVAIGLNFDATIRSETALKRWSNGAGKQVEQIAEGQTQDDPDVKAEMQLIENAILKVDARFMAKYGGVQAASRRLLALRKLPKSKVEPEAAIDSYEIWVSSRLRMLDVDL